MRYDRVDVSPCGILNARQTPFVNFALMAFILPRATFGLFHLSIMRRGGGERGAAARRNRVRFVSFRFAFAREIRPAGYEYNGELARSARRQI